MVASAGIEPSFDAGVDVALDVPLTYGRMAEMKIQYLLYLVLREIHELSGLTSPI
jgi:hypothetical protein